MSFRLSRGIHAAATLFVAGCAYVLMGGPATAAPPPGYTLSWSDEFHEGDGVQPSKSDWNWQVGGNNANNELETYTDDVKHSHVVKDPDATDGQALQILSTDDNGSYTSARMSTSGLHDFQYGFIEARIKIPYGQGIWPAFWMLGSNIGQVGWPRCGEVDIMENIGMPSWFKTNQASLHSGSGSGHGTFDLSEQYHLANGDFHDAYHLFQCWWQPDTISFYVDGHLYETRTKSEYGDNPWPFNAPEFILLNVAVGGGWPGNPDASTVFPQRMLVDYVRVYKGTAHKPWTPTAVTATPGDAKPIVLTWAGGVDATSFNIYRSTSAKAWSDTPLKAGLQRDSYTDNDVEGGKRYYYRIAAVNPAGISTLSKVASAVAPTPVEKSYAGRPAAIPGHIDLADFDFGGEGLAYHDNDAENKGGAFRLDTGVDIENAVDPGDPSHPGYDIGYTEAGEWLKYTVEIAKTGDYGIEFRVSSGAGGGTFHLEDEAGTNLTGPVAVAGTGGWQNWTTIHSRAHLTAGKHVLRLVEDTGGYNLRWMEFTAE